MYESSWYNSGQLLPDQVTPASDELPIDNGIAAAGNSTSYSRGDHVHPQQLSYDGNVTATKFIKTGGTSNDILLADGSTRQSSLAGGQYQVIYPQQYVKLLNSRTGFGQIQFNQH
ncbi:MAG: hypothetical protein EZS28_041385 [Streblomastix strix]|uniref:Uncharacterized protein n=1 Tax=Streblomastix strix TaxID=222440 RepID=A0A5J4TY96_9EUKA|nr:MAG: hypothetical protein EZS28_041385 [Streblomastix strix]